MGKFSRKDFISDLPEGLIDSILTKLPIGDAVRTSILSKRWRYQWATMTRLVFDEKCVSYFDDRKVYWREVVNFIMRFLLLHDGPIHKFKLFTKYMIRSTDIDQWLLFLSRKDIKELVLNVWCSRPFRTPACIFSCQSLTRLKLYGIDVEPPLGFQGFPCLKYLTLDGGTVTLEVIENLISGCPLLEKFKISNYVDKLALTVRSPILKHLTVDGTFKDLYLEYTPLLADIVLSFFSGGWEGNVLVKVPVTYDCLKFILLEGICFKETNQVLYVLRLLLQSPNLQELKIEAQELECVPRKAADLDFWEREFPADFTFKHLKIVKMSKVSNKNDMEFLKFVIGRSPVLEVISVSPNYINKGSMNMVNAVLHIRRASPKVELRFFD